MEGDSTETIKSINGKKNDWNPLEMIVEVSCFRRIEFKTVRRTRYWVAHHLARNACFIFDCDVWLEAPQFIMPFLADFSIIQ